MIHYKPLSVFHVKAEHQSDTKFRGLKTGCRVWRGFSDVSFIWQFLHECSTNTLVSDSVLWGRHCRQMQVAVVIGPSCQTPRVWKNTRLILS